jgi:arylsulfatase A-like enzyme
LALVGASGLELGEHPEAPDVPYDSQLRVPFLLGVKGGDGLAARDHAVLVQTTDLGPTLLDMLDLRSSEERDGDGEVRTGVSLEAYIHGWSPNLPHEALFFASAAHGAVRTNDWKLITPLSSLILPSADGAELYSLTEDPAEVHDLLADGRPMGPTAEHLFGALQDRLNHVDVPKSTATTR